MNKPKKVTLILDLDGVLITTPIWKADEMDADGYSKFNSNCVTNLNLLLKEADFELILSSSRRKAISIEQFNQIFFNRGILLPISQYLPYNTMKKQRRREEIQAFLENKKPVCFLIIDDDKSLLSCNESIKSNLVSTSLMAGFSDHALLEAQEKLKNLLNRT